jgi:hypothetical protein
MASSWRRGSRAGILCLLLVVTGGVKVRAVLAQTAFGTWRTVAPMPTARWGLVAVTALDGEIYAIGGVLRASVRFTTLRGRLESLGNPMPHVCHRQKCSPKTYSP